MVTPISQVKSTAVGIATKVIPLGVFVWNTITKRIHGGDGITVGGIAMARFDERNDGSLGYEQRLETAASNSVTVADIGKAIIGNRATAIAFNLDPAANLTSKFTALFKNIGAGAMTIVPNGAQLIDGANTPVTVPTGSSVIIKGDGTSFRTFLSNGDVTAAAINNATALTGANLADNDKLGVYDTSAASLAGMTITEFVAGIFKAARKIANGYFLSSFRIWDAIDNTKGLAFNVSGVSTGTTRTITVPDKDLSNLDRPLIHVRDQKAAGTDGGASVVGVQVRTLNTVLQNAIAGASLASNQITLPAGTYEIEARVPSYRSNAQQASLRTAAGTYLLDGSQPLSDSTNGTEVLSILSGRFTLGASTAVEIVQYCQTARATNGLGQANASGRNAVFAEAMIWKVD